MRGSGQRLPITLRFTRVLGTFSHTTCFPFSCALWACFSDRSVSGERSEPIGALMPHVALWVVQPDCTNGIDHRGRVSMPHAALWVVQRCAHDNVRRTQGVSMPHAALWVVQLSMIAKRTKYQRCFNAARGFVGGAAWMCASGTRLTFPVSMPHAALWVVQPNNSSMNFFAVLSFNAARGFVGGAALVRDEVTMRDQFQCRTRLCGWCSQPNFFLN